MPRPDPDEERNLKQFSFWKYYQNKKRGMYIMQTRIAVLGFQSQARRAGVVVPARRLTDEKLASIIMNDVLLVDPDLQRLFDSKWHLQFEKSNLIRESLAWLIVSDARDEIMRGL
jgi:hypothetical protein